MVTLPIRPETIPQPGQRVAETRLQPDRAEPSQSVRTVITGIYVAAEISSFPANGAPTAIFKTPVHSRIQIAREGIVGDHQADRRVHGGPEKAIHHYAAINYPKLAAHFPAVAAGFVPGSIGENLSASGVDEGTVAIGDTFALGSARLQLCQPRSPCWKIDSRYGVSGVANYISERCYQGWYYRVLEDGEAVVGDELILLERNPDPVFIREFWSGWRERPPDQDKLARFLGTPGLASVWQRYLTERLSFLCEHPSAHAPVVPAVHGRRE
jgi:MOSC domain-containing protein YiiM